MDRHGADVELGEAFPKGVEVAWRRGSPLPRRRVVDEDLDRARADLLGSLGGAPKALAEGQVDTDSGRVRAGQWDPDRRGGPPTVYAPPTIGSISPKSPSDRR